MVHAPPHGHHRRTTRLSDTHLCTGLLIRDGRVLLVASRYPNHAEPLWNLPGGRQQPAELLTEALRREVREETGLQPTVGELLYVSESYDGDAHFTNFTFHIDAAGEPKAAPHAGDHIVDLAWVPIADIESRVAVRVVREPLLAFLRRELKQRYRGYADAGVSIVFPD